jgi:acetylornithine deacetylase
MAGLKAEAIALLSKLIETPSFSGKEDGTAALIQAFLEEKGIPFQRHLNNIWAVNKCFDKARPTILLNSHHDTVLPNQGYTRDPFKYEIAGDKIFGLGSNDAGGSLVSLLASFIYFYEQDLNYNLLIAATAEEETSGANGISAVLKEFGPIDFAIVGEPTLMDMAIAEKGLLVIDCVAKGTSSHAAHPNNDNAIYNALRDIERIRSYHFPKVSDLLGSVKMTVTIINAGSQHNVVPAECKFTIDVRTNEHYGNDEVIGIIAENLSSEVHPRSLRLNSSHIDSNHAIVKAAQKCGCQLYGSPTISDQALMPFPSVKIGPGDSRRSHTADEFIFVREIEEGIDKYIQILSQIL